MNETTVKLELIDSNKGDWRIYNLSTWGANVERYDGKNKTTAWASFSTPEGYITAIAVPNHPGAGPQPENTETIIYVQDLIRGVVRDLEQVVTEKLNEKKGEW